MGSSTVSRVAIDRSRRLIQDSRVHIASAKELIRQSQETIRQHTYLKIVCAWCQETIRFERAEGAVWEQISQSICFDCFAPMFGELAPVNAPPAFSQKAKPATPAPSSGRLLGVLLHLRPCSH